MGGKSPRKFRVLYLSSATKETNQVCNAVEGCILPAGRIHSGLARKPRELQGSHQNRGAWISEGRKRSG